MAKVTDKHIIFVACDNNRIVVPLASLVMLSQVPVVGSAEHGQIKLPGWRIIILVNTTPMPIDMYRSEGDMLFADLGGKLDAINITHGEAPKPAIARR